MKIILLCVVLIINVSCTTAAEVALNALGGALGNMLDRRFEDKLGNDAGLSDEKLDDSKLTMKKEIK